MAKTSKTQAVKIDDDELNLSSENQIPVSTPVEVPEQVQEPDKPGNSDVKKTWIYIGPTMHRTRLIQNSIITGTRAEIEEYFKIELSNYPAAKHLIVDIRNLAEYREKIKNTDNYIGKKYADMVVNI